ncbi:S8 family peptidase [Nostoc sp. 'Peltigera membranacea cyanobiont' 232]|uniref:S8 family peptidase n=1 Tax=Nostoc sp. 'Peltigera membranacea cyanobiont' 232 TaxID=2014531 RepID=UPI000B9511A8|nr:S8 family peptidase [Nostoc sp. 'Peltigera membranacea cyanobiont' 232]OYE01377.1 peptidase S8 [Nostoc sp. 'Peltigera membranacea cyanobiont' 232]
MLNDNANKRLNVTPTSSLDSFNPKDDHSLNFIGRSSYNSNSSDVQLLNNSDSTTNNTFSTKSYSSTDGYGLTNAAAAVAKATAQNTYADVVDLGGNNWGADLVKAPEVWAHGYTGKGVVVAVLDTGVDYNHQDLKDNIWTNSKENASNGIDNDGNGYANDIHGWNFVDNNNNVLDDNGHGTHVSGIIAGENNNYGVTGVAYNAKIMPVKVLDSSGSGNDTTISKGIHYAVDNGANVINLSLGSMYPDDTLKSAIEYASSKGVTVVMAAGNDGSSSPDYPASYASTTGIAVGAVDKNNQMADFSNRSGTQTTTYVTAPGVDVYSSVPNNQYATHSGTSMASPYVAGVVALMLSANHDLTQSQIRDLVTSTAGNSTQSSSYTSEVQSLTSSAIFSQQSTKLLRI